MCLDLGSQHDCFLKVTFILYVTEFRGMSPIGGPLFGTTNGFLGANLIMEAVTVTI